MIVDIRVKNTMEVLGFLVVPDGQLTVRVIFYASHFAELLHPSPYPEPSRDEILEFNIEQIVKKTKDVGWFSDFLHEWCVLVEPEVEQVRYAILVERHIASELANRQMLRRRIVQRIK